MQIISTWRIRNISLKPKRHIFMKIRIWRQLAQQRVDPSTGRTYLATYNLNLAYTFDQTYGVTFAYKKINGSHSPILDEGIIIDQTRPNSQYLYSRTGLCAVWQIHFVSESVAEFAHQLAVYWLFPSQRHQR